MSDEKPLRLYRATVEVDVFYWAIDGDHRCAIDAAGDSIRDGGYDATAFTSPVVAGEACPADGFAYKWPRRYRPSPSIGEYVTALREGGQERADALVQSYLSGRTT